MSNGSSTHSPVTGEPIDVHEEQARKKEAAEKAIKEKVVEAVNEIGKVVRKTIGPPGTP